MAYFEELLPEFRNGAKIRKNYLDEGQYIYYEDDNIYTHENLCINLTGDELVAGYWELYKDPEPDWQYIIDHKCLCWFWDRNESDKVLGFLQKVNEKKKLCTFIGCNNQNQNLFCYYYDNCRPVRRDEVTFYEEK